MVEYTEWTKIAFEVARDDVPQQRVIQRASQVWNQNKRQLERMSVSDARRIARREL